MISAEVLITLSRFTGAFCHECGRQIGWVWTCDIEEWYLCNDCFHMARLGKEKGRQK